MLLHPGVYVCLLEPDQATDLVVGDLLDPGVEGLGLDAEVGLRDRLLISTCCPCLSLTIDKLPSYSDIVTIFMI